MWGADAEGTIPLEAGWSADDGKSVEGGRTFGCGMDCCSYKIVLSGQSLVVKQKTYRMAHAREGGSCRAVPRIHGLTCCTARRGTKAEFAYRFGRGPFLLLLVGSVIAGVTAAGLALVGDRLWRYW